MTSRSLRAACLAAAVASLPPAMSNAQTRSERALAYFEEGVALMDQERFQEALVPLQRSLELQRTQAALFNFAMCFRKEERYREALIHFETLVSEFGSQMSEERFGIVRRQIEELRGLVQAMPAQAPPPPGPVQATLRVEADVERAQVSIDGETVGETPIVGPVAPGRHSIEVRADGYEPYQAEVMIAAGERRRLVASMEEGKGLQPGWFWLAAGLAGAATVTTAVLGTMALQGDADFNVAETRTAEDRDAGKRLVLLTDVFLVVAIASSLGALLLYGKTDFASGEDLAP